MVHTIRARTAIVFTTRCLAILAIVSANAQNLRLTPTRGASNTLDLTLSGAAPDQYHRVDYSTDFSRWSPLDILLNTNSTKQLTDSNILSRSLRFYRAQQVDPVTQVIRVTPSSGAPGSSIVIEGQFFTSGQPGENIVLFGGVEGTVTEVTATRMVVTVPTGAQTGFISVNTPRGNSFSEQIFTAIGSNSVNFLPSAPLNAAEFDVGTDFGNGVSNSPSHFGVSVGLNLPTLVVAAPKDTNKLTPFFALSGPHGAEVTLNALSTARALVFQCPLFLTTDSVIAERLQNIIATDSSVGALAQVIAQVYATNSTNPFAASNFVAAYQAAIISVGTNGDILQLAARLRSEHKDKPPQTASIASVYPLEWYQTRFLELEGSGNKFKVQASAFNPVDWLVFFDEVDVDKAFPNGRSDFSSIHQQNFPPVQLYPLKSGFHEERHISADLAASRINFVSYLSKEFVKALTKPFVDDSVRFPGNDTIYVMRGVGPAFVPPEDFNFVQQNYQDVYVRVVAMNLVAAAIDLATAAIDSGKLEETLGDAKFRVKLIDEAIKQAPTIHSGEDFVVAASKVLAFLLKEYVNDAIKAGIKAATEAAFKATADALKGVLENKKLKVASGVGQVAERATGLFRTTTLETLFVVVGDPFQLQVLSITPAGARPGADLTIVFRGSPMARQFDPKNAQDQVNFEGFTTFDGQVLSATGPDASGVQTLTVRVPADLAASADGNYTVYVNTQGRRGSGSFTLTSRPVITSLSPQEGFAPGLLAGSPFAGTQTRIKGANFVSSDTFLFAGGTSGVEATNKSGSSGNVLLRVPAGAQTGPVKIQKLYSGVLYETSGPPFTVLGPPVLLSMSPSNGPVGTTVAFTANNLGKDVSALLVQFPGKTPTAPGLQGNVASISVPSGATSGPVTLFTPAGQVTSTFLVSTGLAMQGAVSIGGGSIISLSRACDIVSGVGPPIDDDADFLMDSMGNIIARYDPPEPGTSYEEGDFVTDNNGTSSPRFPVGAGFADNISISGIVGGSGTLAGQFDRVSGGTMAGDLIIAGDNNTLSIGLTVSGSVTVNGNNNTIDFVTFRNCPGHALIIRGNNNRILSSSFFTNGGDGIRIEGGKYNYIEINDSKGNGGNGITLTGGAEYNTVKLVTGSTISGKGVLDSGNAGHGVALIGEAHFNDITTFSPGIFGNRKDGVYLDGSGVYSNRFTAIVSSDNRGNGVTVTNGARGNMFGTVDFDGTSIIDLTAHRNGGSGAAFYGARDFQVAVRCNSNQNQGLLFSGVVETNNFTKALLSSSIGNGAAAARLEQGTRGVEIRTSSSTKTNRHGLELVGSDVVLNSFTMDIADSTNNGVNLVNARSNQFILTVDRSAGHGIFLSGGGGNSFRIRSINTSQGDGLVLTDGTTNNRVYPDAFVATFNSNRNGIWLDNGARNNLIDRLSAINQRSNGVVLHGGFTADNRFLKAGVSRSGLDGIRIEFGANRNLIGYEPANAAFGVADSTIQDNAMAGIRITDPGTDSNVVVRAFLTSSVRTQAVGVLIENGAAHTTLRYNSLSRNTDGVIVRNTVRDVTMQHLYIDSNTQRGIAISNATEVLIGTSDPTDYNQITRNTIGIEMQGLQAATNRVSNNFIQNNTNAGVVLKAGAHHNQIGLANDLRTNTVGILLDNAHTNTVRQNLIVNHLGDCIQITNGAGGNQIFGNSISNNLGGVSVSGPASLGNSVLVNALTDNNLKGITLTAGGNAMLPAPQQMEFILDTLSGTAMAADGSRVEIFKDNGDEGATLLAVGSVAENKFRVPLQVDFTEVGFLYNINATITDPGGNTSEFGTTSVPGLPPAKVVFTSTRDGNQELYMRENASVFGSASGGTRLTSNPAADHSPSLDCNRQVVLFVSDRSGNDDIYTMPAIVNGMPTQLTTNPARDYDPRWMTNCVKIIFISERDGLPAIFTMDANGANQMRLSPPGGSDVSPSVSSDGSKVVFASNRGGNFDIYVMNADGTGAVPLAAHPAADTQPALSPDGQTIAFASNRDGNAEIYTVRVNGTQLTRVTNSAAADVNPSWTPDGLNILFSSDRNAAGYELYLVSKNGGSPRRFSISGGDNTEASAR